MARKQLKDYNLACSLVQVIDHFFPDLIKLLKGISDPRHQSYIIYENHVLLMTRILSSIFYISSMRKTSEEFNSEEIISNVGFLCGQELDELPYWETVNNYLKRFDPGELQELVLELVRRLVRSRGFEGARVRGKHWQVIIDATKLLGSREELDGGCLHRVHNKGQENEYTEYYYYVLEAKLCLREDVYVSIMTEFAGNPGEEVDVDNESRKQDCELKACYRLMDRLKEAFPRLPVVISGDSLYACRGFFEGCRKRGWHFLVRFKGGSIPSVREEYEALKKLESHRVDEAGGEAVRSYDFVNGIDYHGVGLNLAEYREAGMEYTMYFLTDLTLSRENVAETVRHGRRRWAIENRGFNAQKNHGYFLGHRFSHDGKALKNHYYLMQIGHMIAQVMEAWGTIWRNIRQSMAQKHQRILDSFKRCRLSDEMASRTERIQIRFG